MRKKILILTFFLFLFFTGLYAQTVSQTNFNTFQDGVLPWNDFQNHFSNTVKAGNIERDIIWENWYDPFGADGYNVRPHMALCQDGGYAVTGYYIIEDEWGGYLEWCGYVLKTDSDGNFLWADKDTLSFIGETESDCIIETSDGGLINGGDGYMIKRDTDGNRLWYQIIYGGIGVMCKTNDGNLLITGGTQTGELLLRKIDEDGNQIWNKDILIGSSWTSGTCIIPTSDGGYAISGCISDEIGNSDIYAIKTNSVGDTLWTYRKDGYGGWDQANWLIEDSNNELLVVGEVDIPGSVRGYYAKLSLDGELLHEEILDPNSGYNCWYTVDLPDENAYLVTAVPNIIKFDYDFNIVWVEYMDTLLNYYHKLPDGYIFYSNGVHLMRTDDNIVQTPDNTIPETDELLRIYPNPFNPTTTISYSIPAAAAVELSIYNVKGQKVVTLVKQHQEAGAYSTQWNGTDEQNNSVASGVYFYKLSDDSGRSSVQKCLLLK